MCPIAEILFHRGYTITGSDMNEGDTLDRVRSYGIEVHMGHRAENVEGADLVVYTAAVKSDNPELQAAREKGIPCVERSVMLGMLVDRYPRFHRDFRYPWQNHHNGYDHHSVFKGRA